MNQKDLSFVLEVINGDWALESFALMLVCLGYLFHELNSRKLWAELGSHGFMFWRWRLDWTVGMRVAAAIATLSSGIFITRSTIYIWRAIYGAGDFGMGQLIALILGAALGAVGFLCAIREISMPLYGRCPWIATLAALLLTTAMMVLFRYGVQ